jgi:hypothetical protein
MMGSDRSVTPRIAVTPASRAPRQAKAALLVLPLAMLTFLVLLGVGALVGGDVISGGDAMFELALTSVTVGCILRNVFAGEDRAFANLNNPLAFYSAFFFLYCPLPFVVLLFTGTMPSDNGVTIAALMLLSYGAMWLGVRVAERRSTRTMSIRLVGSDATILYGLCLLAIGLIVYVYIWREQNGVFFSHSRYYEEALTASSAFRDVFVAQLQLPVILLLGVAAAQTSSRWAKAARRTLYGYTIALFVVCVLASQTRLAITALIFCLAAIRLYSPRQIGARHVVVAAGAGVLGLVLIQVVRVVINDRYAAAKHQASFAVEEALPTAWRALRAGGDVEGAITGQVVSRSGGAISFLSDIINATRIRGGYVGLNPIFESLPTLIPRVVWPQKPPTVSPPLVIESQLGLMANDAPVMATTEFFVMFGITGVAIGYALFGFALALVSRYSVSSRHVGFWILGIFLWSHVVQVEQEIVLGSLSALRNGLVFLTVYIGLVELTRALGIGRRRDEPLRPRPAIS